jgi:hypothetical protein
MDFTSRLLMTIDAVREQLFSLVKRNADDYYEAISAVDNHTIKMNDGSFISFFELRGFAASVNNKDMYDVSKRLERSLDGYLPNPGYAIQIVELSDEDLTRTFALESMQSSFDEMKNLGIDHRSLTSDYLDFICNLSVWKKKFIVVSSSKKVMSGVKVHSQTPSSEEVESLHLMSSIVSGDIKKSVDEQVVFMGARDAALFRKHSLFAKSVHNEFSREGVLLRHLDVSIAIRNQKQSIYGKACPSDWMPALGNVGLSKLSDFDIKPGQVKLEVPSLVEQVISVGGTEAGLPPEVLRFGDRFFTTVSMVIPQQDNDLKSYRHIISRIPKSLNYMCSFRMESAPFSTSEYSVEQFYTGISAIIPMSDNLHIRRARTELRTQHDNGLKTGVFLQVTFTLFAKDTESLLENRDLMNSVLSGWNRAQFRSVELNKTQGLFDSIPGASKKSHLKKVLENFADAIFQSPLFTQGALYDRGFLHMLTEDNQPFPLEEHSARNMNYNAYLCGLPGSGKSTLLSVLNLALLCKPKTNPELKGMFPLIMDVDFGKTSFGLKKMLRHISPKEKAHNFLLHEMTTDISSSINPHDLILGRVSPTVQQKDLIVRFMMVLVFGITKTNGAFVVNHPELEPMIKYLVDAVYSYRKEDETPRLYLSGEFRHADTISFMSRIGINVNPDYSYYALADEVMRLEPKLGIRHAMILRRYGVPRVTDYSEVLINNPEISSRFDSGVMSGGKTHLKFFLERIGYVINEFPCFSRATVVDLDMARLISLDINLVCGESDYRKAVFGSLCLMAFSNKVENTESSPDLLNDVKPQYHDALRKISKMNIVLPGALNIEEAHVLFALFDDLLISAQRKNRKAGWGMRSLSQDLMDPSDAFFSKCSSVYIASEQNGDGVEKRLDIMNCNREERKTIKTSIEARTFFLYIKTRKSSGGFDVPRIGVKLTAALSPGVLWFSNSEQVDQDFLSAIIEKIGFDAALNKVPVFFTGGTIRGYLDSKRVEDLSKEKGFGSVFELLVAEVVNGNSPSPELARLL